MLVIIFENIAYPWPHAAKWKETQLKIVTFVFYCSILCEFNELARVILRTLHLGVCANQQKNKKFEKSRFH
jgi:hypothetical protein